MSSIPDDKKDHVINLLAEGRKIEAIQYVRSAFGLDLKKAKDLIDAVEKEYLDESLRTNMTGRKPLTIPPVGLIFGAIGIIFLGLAFFFFSITQEKMDDGTLVVGEVIGMNGGSDGGHAPEIAYKFDGVEYVYYSNVYSNPPSYEIGEKVEVYVNASYPNDPLINTFSEKWLLVVIFGAIGSIFFLIGAVFIFVTLKPTPKK